MDNPLYLYDLEYKKGTKLLEKLIEDKISVIVSHDKKEKIIDILKNYWVL